MTVCFLYFITQKEPRDYRHALSLESFYYQTSLLSTNHVKHLILAGAILSQTYFHKVEFPPVSPPFPLLYILLTEKTSYSLCIHFIVSGTVEILVKTSISFNGFATLTTSQSFKYLLKKCSNPGMSNSLYSSIRDGT